jgi:trk system potassium uptake protein
MVQHSLAEIPRLVPATDMRIVAIYRQDNAITELTGATRIEPGDEVFVLAATEKLRAVLGALRKMDRPAKRIMIAGGGKVGLRLARQLRGEVQMKIIEVNRARCDYLATQLPADVLILNGDSTDEELMGDENVQDMDLFLALTSDDEDNIMACLLAKRMGARRVLALINRKAYADLVQGTTIDIALSPSHAVIGELLAYVRRGDVEAVHSLRRGAAEALEAIVRGDKGSCKMAGRRIEEIALPRGVQIGAIVRGLPALDDEDALALGDKRADVEARARPEVIIAHHDTVVRTGDRVIVFMPSKKQVREVERLFQVAATFMG